MNAPAKGFVWGAVVCGVTWLAAALLWTSYAAVPASLFILVPLALLCAGVAGWFQAPSPRITVAWATFGGVVATALGMLVLSFGVGAARMPVEPVTFGAFMLLASPALAVTAAAAQRLRLPRATRRAE